MDTTTIDTQAISWLTRARTAASEFVGGIDRLIATTLCRIPTAPDVLYRSRNAYSRMVGYLGSAITAAEDGDNEPARSLMRSVGATSEASPLPRTLAAVKPEMSDIDALMLLAGETTASPAVAQDSPPPPVVETADDVFDQLMRDPGSTILATRTGQGTVSTAIVRKSNAGQMQNLKSALATAGKISRTAPGRVVMEGE